MKHTSMLSPVPLATKSEYTQINLLTRLSEFFHAEYMYSNRISESIFEYLYENCIQHSLLHYMKLTALFLFITTCSRLNRFRNWRFYVCTSTDTFTYTRRWHRCHRLFLYGCFLCKRRSVYLRSIKILYKNSNKNITLSKSESDDKYSSLL